MHVNRYIRVSANVLLRYLRAQWMNQLAVHTQSNMQVAYMHSIMHIGIYVGTHIGVRVCIYRSRVHAYLRPGPLFQSMACKVVC